MGGPLPLHFKQAEGIKDLVGIRGRKLGGQYFGGRTVQHRGGGLLDVDAMLADAFLQGSNVFLAHNRNRYQPDAHQDQRNPTDLARRPMESGGKEENSQSREAVPQAPDDGVNEPLDLQLDSRGQRQIEQLCRGFIQGVAQHLVAAFQGDGRAQIAEG